MAKKAGILGSLLLAGAGFIPGPFGALAQAAVVGVLSKQGLVKVNQAGIASGKRRRKKQRGGADDSAARETSEAGVSINALTIGETVTGVVGKRRVSLPLVAPPFVTMELGKKYAHVMVGGAGRCLVEDVQINGIAAGEVQGAVVEVFEGDGSGAVSTFMSGVTRFMDERQSGVTLTNFDLRDEAQEQIYLTDQTTPEKSEPGWHLFKSNGAVDRLLVRLVFDSGIVSNLGESFGIPIRSEIRQVGTSIWRKGPVLHVADLKGNGPIVVDIEMVWGFDSGIWYNRTLLENDAAVFKPNFDMFYASWRTGFGETFSYDADSYFDPVNGGNPATDFAPVMTGNTLGGITVSASHNNSTAWNAVDGNISTGWSPPLNTFGPNVWWQIDWGAGNEKAVGRYAFNRGFSDTDTPGNWEFYGSQDGVTFTLLHKANEKGTAHTLALYNIASSISWRYHRIVIFSNNGDATGLVALRYTRLMAARFGASGNRGQGNVSGYEANNVVCGRDGAKIFLDPNNGWPRGDYEVRFKRGWAFKTADLGVGGSNYTYAASTTNADFFEAYTDSGQRRVRIDQKVIQSDVTVSEVMITENVSPIRADIESRLTRIAVRVPDLTVSSISANLTRYARPWNGSEWADTPIPTRNPAAHYRDALLMVDNNATPLPGELIEAGSLEAYNEWCAAEGYSVDAVVTDRSVDEILELLTSTARAVPRRSNKWGIAIDRDRSLDTVDLVLTPENSRDLGTTVSFETLPHALVIEYLDDSLREGTAEVTVYRNGYDVTNATLFERETYPEISTAAAATAHGTYRLRSRVYRNKVYRREVGFIGYQIDQFALIGLSDEVINRHAYYGLVKSINTSAGNVIGVGLYGIARLSESAEAISDTEGVLGDFGAAITLLDGSTFIAAIDENSDTSTVTFTTPVADTGQFTINQPVAIGPLAHETVRLMVIDKQASGEHEWVLSMAPEAPEIFV